MATRKQLRPPTDSAIADALGILMQSINKENGTSFNECRFENLTKIRTQGPSIDPLKHAGALELAAASLEAFIRSKIIPPFHSRHNELLPVHQLPDEIFSGILETLVDGEETTIRMKNIDTLSLVSRRWRLVVLNSPAIWAVADNVLQVPALKSCLDRSRMLPLAVVCSGTLSASFSRLATEHSRRWRSLNFSVYSKWTNTSSASGQAELQHLLDAPSPLLEDITAIQYSSYTKSGVIQLAEGGPLRNLTLQGISIDWASPRLQGLRSLDLAEVQCCPTQLASLLESCPQLETICLSSLYESESHPPPTSPAVASIMLRNLQTLETKTLKLPYLKCLFLGLHAPNCRRIYPNALVASIMEPGNLLVTVLHHSSSFHVNLSSKNVQIICIKEDCEPVIIDFRGLGSNHLESSLAFLHSNLPDRPLHLTYPLNVQNFSHYLNPVVSNTCAITLGRLDMLRELSTGDIVLAYSILEHLAIREGSSWPCPRLQVIHLAYERQHPDLEYWLIEPLRLLVRSPRWTSSDGSMSPVLEVSLKGHVAFPSLAELAEEAKNFGIMITFIAD